MRVTVGRRIFSARVRTAANISQELLGDEGAKCTPWTQEPRLTIFEVAIMVDLAARSQVSTPETRERYSIYMSPFQCYHRWKGVAGSSRLHPHAYGSPSFEHPCKTLFKDGGTARWLSGSCLSACACSASIPYIGMHFGAPW